MFPRNQTGVDLCIPISRSGDGSDAAKVSLILIQVSNDCGSQVAEAVELLHPSRLFDSENGLGQQNATDVLRVVMSLNQSDAKRAYVMTAEESESASTNEIPTLFVEGMEECDFLSNAMASRQLSLLLTPLRDLTNLATRDLKLREQARNKFPHAILDAGLLAIARMPMADLLDMMEEEEEEQAQERKPSVEEGVTRGMKEAKA